MTGISRVPSARDLDFESMPPLVVSPYLELREPADPAAAPVRAVAPVAFNGRIDPPGDEDRFVLAVTPGSRVRIKVQAYDLGSALDPVLRVEGKGGSAIANADDTTIPLPPKNGMAQSLILPDPTIETTVPGGTNEITVVIRDLERRGGVGFPYRIVAEPLEPDFEIAAQCHRGERAAGRHGGGRSHRQAQGVQRSDHRRGGWPARRPRRSARPRSPPARRPAR